MKKYLRVIHGRARKLKNFACFDNCATYPNCQRLNIQYRLLMNLKQTSDQVINNIINKFVNRSPIQGRHSFQLTISCPEFKSEQLDMGD